MYDIRADYAKAVLSLFDALDVDEGTTNYDFLCRACDLLKDVRGDYEAGDIDKYTFLSIVNACHSAINFWGYDPKYYC